MSDTKTERDYSTTLFLPKTDFPMRAGLPKKEPEILAKWESMDLYKALREQSKGRPKYVLHDGPPYANGNIHIGHALNKILKDLITRSFSRCVAMTPITCRAGIVTVCRSNGRSRRNIALPARTRTTCRVNEFREECRQFAKHWIGVQTRGVQAPRRGR